MEKFLKAVREILIPLITAITAVMVVVLNHSVSKVDHDLQQRDQFIKEKIAELDLAIRQTKEEREERESKQDFNLKIYDIVTSSLKEKNRQQQEVATAFIVVMVEDPLRSSLLNVLKQGGEPEVQRDVKQILAQENQFKSEEKEMRPVIREQVPGFNWEDWDYDIFWCASSGASASEQADLIKQQLLSEGAKGRIRVRTLPDSINAKSGYQISGYAIRRNHNEEPQAKALQELSERTLKRVGAKFEIGLSTQPTPWYVSAFICP